MNKFRQHNLRTLFSFALGVGLALSWAQDSAAQWSTQTGMTEAGSCEVNCSGQGISTSLDQILSSLPEIIQVSLDEHLRETVSEETLAPVEAELELQQAETEKEGTSRYLHLLPYLKGIDESMDKASDSQEISAEERDEAEAAIRRMRDNLRSIRRLELYADADSSSKVILRNFRRIEYHQDLSEHSRLKGSIDQKRFMLEYNRRF